MRNCLKKLGLVDPDQTHWPDRSCFYCFPRLSLSALGGNRRRIAKIS
jgi:hypothetical protein